MNGHFLSVNRMSSYRSLHLRLFEVGIPPDKREIASLRCSQLNLRLQTPVREIRFRHQDQPAGVFIQTMNDSGSQLPPYAGEIFGMK